MSAPSDLARSVEQFRLHLDLFVEHLHVTRDALLIARDDLVASTVVAQRMAERDMDVQRQRQAACVAFLRLAPVVGLG
jgi:hypothetical protein